MSRELDAECARALGWTQYPVFLPNCVTYYGVPPFSTSPDAARLLEDEIERRGLEEEYARAMMKIIYSVGFRNYAHSQYLLIRATPEQRARAFLEAVKE